MTGRSVPEWIGKTPDSRPPPRVRRRVFDAYFGICYLSDRKIDPVKDEWHLEHKIPLSEGGMNRESNMAPALVEPHKEKTKKEAAVRKKVNRTRNKHLRIHAKPKGRSIPGSRNSPFKRRLTSQGPRTERRGIGPGQRT